MTAAVMPSSAAGLLTLLEDENDELKRYALVHLNKVVHEFWFQISSYIGSVEALYEDDEFADRELAALIASKVFYHLGELDSALTYALGAGKHFIVDEQSEYVQTLVARCLDQYFELRTREVEQVDVDPRLVAVVERMLNRCCEHGQFEQAVGVALEGRRLDKLEEVVQRSNDVPATLGYALKVCQKLVINRDFRQQVREVRWQGMLQSSSARLSQRPDLQDRPPSCNQLQQLKGSDWISPTVISSSVVGTSPDGQLMQWVLVDRIHPACSWVWSSGITDLLRLHSPRQLLAVGRRRIGSWTG
eukprot:GHUV01028595.1.p1 GENE.GHUV01028595.1~~GHUV01028595.1.p1  ORF type:complete len:303 (+),score=82.68 GHUV01028595.1:207-1115(+)